MRNFIEAFIVVLFFIVVSSLAACDFINVQDNKVDLHIICIPTEKIDRVRFYNDRFVKHQI